MSSTTPITSAISCSRRAKDGRNMARNSLQVIELRHETVFRYSSYDTPLWARNNSGHGRWHVAGDGATQYLSFHPDGAWADLIRHEGLQSEEEVELVRMRMWALELSQNGIVDYSTFDRAEEAGFSPEALVDDDQRRCQVEGQRLRSEGYHGVIAPSAALPGALNVTIFGRRFKSSWGASTRLASAVPCCQVAVGSPPRSLVTRVRQVGQVHSGYVQWLASDAEGLALTAQDEEERDGRAANDE